jgi:hypothetical protein
MTTDSFENENVVISINEGVLFMKYKKALLDLECAKDVIQSRLAFCQEITYPLFVDITNVKKTTQEARSYMSKGEGEKFASAAALWGTSELTRLLANFFLSINRPKVPVRFFNDQKKALQWLKQFKTNSKHP